MINYIVYGPENVHVNYTKTIRYVPIVMHMRSTKFLADSTLVLMQKPVETYYRKINIATFIE